MENLDVAHKLNETQQHWWDGFHDGYYAPPHPLRDFLVHKAAYLWTPYEQGFWYGMQTKQHEEDRP